MNPKNIKNGPEVKLDKEFNLLNDFSPPSYQEWKSMADSGLEGRSSEKALVTKTYENIDLLPIYLQSDLKNNPNVFNFPGYDNFVRGTSVSGYITKSWDIAQQIKCTFAEDYNKALRYDLERGLNSINIDLNQAIKEGSALNGAKNLSLKGVCISDLTDITQALSGVDLGKYPLYIKAGFSSLEFLALLISYCKNSGFDLNTITGSVEADPVGLLSFLGYLPMHWDDIYDRMAIAVKWCHKNGGKIKTVGVDTRYYHNAGGSIVQNTAIAFATGVEYLNRLIDRGISIDTAARSIRFTFEIGPFFFMEIARLRAARMIWAKIVKSYGGNKEAQKITMHARTSTFNQTKYDPHVNMLRTTTETLSAILGGVNSLETNEFNELLVENDEIARRVARNIQLLLKHECHLDSLIDPAGGSYYIESLTRQAGEKTWKLFQNIEKEGGILNSLKSGHLQSRIVEVAAKRKQDIEFKKSIMVGTNSFVNVKEKIIKRKKAGHEQPDKAKKNINDLKNYTSLFARKDRNKKYAQIIETAVELVEKGCSIPQLFKPFLIPPQKTIKELEVFRAAEGFEKIRDEILKYYNRSGNLPRVFLASVGEFSSIKVRVDFTRAFFGSGGFEIINPGGFTKPGEVVKEALNSQAEIIVLISVDEAYPRLVSGVAGVIKERNPDIITVLAGDPKEKTKEYQAAGIDYFIHLKVNALDILSEVIEKIGIKNA